jgi:hypothetical protein
MHIHVHTGIYTQIKIKYMDYLLPVSWEVDPEGGKAPGLSPFSPLKPFILEVRRTPINGVWSVLFDLFDPEVPRLEDMDFCRERVLVLGGTGGRAERDGPTYSYMYMITCMYICIHTYMYIRM